MTKLMINVAAVMAMALSAVAGTVAGTDRADWFRDGQYGLFVHWGCYSVPAKGEWMLNRTQMYMV